MNKTICSLLFNDTKLSEQEQYTRMHTYAQQELITLLEEPSLLNINSRWLTMLYEHPELILLCDIHDDKKEIWYELTNTSILLPKFNVSYKHNKWYIVFKHNGVVSQSSLVVPKTDHPTQQWNKLQWLILLTHKVRSINNESL